MQSVQLGHAVASSGPWSNCFSPEAPIFNSLAAYVLSFSVHADTRGGVSGNGCSSCKGLDNKYLDNIGFWFPAIVT